MADKRNRVVQSKVNIHHSIHHPVMHNCFFCSGMNVNRVDDSCSKIVIAIDPFDRTTWSHGFINMFGIVSRITYTMAPFATSAWARRNWKTAHDEMLRERLSLRASSFFGELFWYQLNSNSRGFNCKLFSLITSNGTNLVMAWSSGVPGSPKRFFFLLLRIFIDTFYMGVKPLTIPIVRALLFLIATRTTKVANPKQKKKTKKRNEIIQHNLYECDYKVLYVSLLLFQSIAVM